MRKTKSVTFALITTLLMIVNVATVLAAGNTVDVASQVASVQTITPRWENTFIATSHIAISGKKISASASIEPKKSTIATTGTLYLEKKSGNGWVTVTSWAINETGSVSVVKTYNGTTGVTYRTRLVATVGADKIETTSNECTI